MIYGIVYAGASALALATGQADAVEIPLATREMTAR